MRRMRALVPYLACVTVAFAFALAGLLRHWHFDSNAYDLGIYDQWVWHASRVEIPASSLLGIPNMLADHFSPVLFLLAPLYWVWPRPETLIVVQACLLSATLVPVFKFSQPEWGRGRRS